MTIFVYVTVPRHDERQPYGRATSTVCEGPLWLRLLSESFLKRKLQAFPCKHVPNPSRETVLDPFALPSRPGSRVGGRDQGGSVTIV